MGYNTTVVVMNDSLHAIQDDPDFGKKLVGAIMKKTITRDPIDVSALGHCNAATVIETHHADCMVPVLVGANMGRELVDGCVGWGHDEVAQEIQMIRQLAEKHGFRLTKKAKK